jgi:ectoine hydroxylase-related dioxygenase (phytanoyl-CoA dioxygenase family)
MDGSPVREVTDAEREAYARDGFVLLKGIYPARWVESLKTQLEDIFDRQPHRAMDQRSVTGGRTEGIRVDMAALASGMRAAVPDASIAVEGGNDTAIVGRSIVETDAASWHSGIRHHHLEGPLPEIVAGLTGTGKVVFYSDQLFLKEPGSRIRTPFHQDEPYFLVQGEVAVCWVPVDPVNRENGCMGYVRGSHRWGRLFKPSDFVTEHGTFPERDGIEHSGLESLPPIDVESPDVVYLEADPGDVIVHHWSTVHGAAGNVSGSAIRRAASVRYALGDSRYCRRASSPEPFRDTVDLRDGEPLDRAARFPVVWPRAGRQ